MSEWHPGEVRIVPIETLGERYRRYRLPDAEAEAAMARSLTHYGQMAPIVVCRPQVEYVLARPREALAQAQAVGGRVYDPRLSAAGNRVARQLSELLERLTRMENWLRQRGRADLTASDGGLLAERFARLAGDAGTVAALASDRYEELRLT